MVHGVCNKPSSACAGPFSNHADRLIDPLSNRAGRLIDPLSDSARPQPVYNLVERLTNGSTVNNRTVTYPLTMNPCSHVFVYPLTMDLLLPCISVCSAQVIAANSEKLVTTKVIKVC